MSATPISSTSALMFRTAQVHDFLSFGDAADHRARDSPPVEHQVTAVDALKALHGSDIDQRGGRVGCACQQGSCEDAYTCDENLASPRQDRVGPFIFLVKLMVH